jgi:hypothetical protein
MPRRRPRPRASPEAQALARAIVANHAAVDKLVKYERRGWTKRAAAQAEVARQARARLYRAWDVYREVATAASAVPVGAALLLGADEEADGHARGVGEDERKERLGVVDGRGEKGAERE